MRLKLLNIIQEYASNDRMDETTTIRLTWNRIKRNPMVKPVVKRYLADHVRGTFRRIDAEEMMVAVLLPVQRFVRQEKHKYMLILDELSIGIGDHNDTTRVHFKILF